MSTPSPLSCGNPRVAARPLARGLRALLTVLAIAGAAESAAAQRVCLRSSMDGLQVVPPSGSAASGLGQIVVDTEANRLVFFYEVGGLASRETAADIHGLAPAGQGAPPLHALPAGSTKLGVWAYGEPQEEGILRGLTYSDVHTSASSGGEIRGQNLRAPGDPGCLACDLAPLSSVPPGASNASGFGEFWIDTAANELHYFIEYSQLSSPEIAAHIHGPNHQGGGPPNVILHTLGVGSPKAGVWAYDEASEQDLFDGLCWVNVHTQNHFPGEIEGFLRPVHESPTYCTAKLNSQGCSPFLSSDPGSPEDGGAPWRVRANLILNGRNGLFLYGFGRASAPFQGGLLCVAPPVARSRVLPSGGQPPPDDCSGSISIDLQTLPQPAGTAMHLQGWSRDPQASFGSSLTDAIEVVWR